MADNGINLDHLAAGSRPSDKWQRTVNRTRKANPFEPKLQASYDNGEQATRKIKGGGTRDGIDGEPFEVTVSNEDQAHAVVRALRLAAKHLGIGVRVNATDFEDDDGNPVVRYYATEKRPRGESAEDESGEYEQAPEEAAV
jgi:hypothetical protein